MELLFESRRNVSGMSGLLRAVQHRPTIRQTPVLTPGGPGDALGTFLYGSVHHHEGLYRLWYYAITTGQDPAHEYHGLAYAESLDGDSWTKPALDLLPGLRAGANMTDLGLHSGTVFIDPLSPAERRCRAVGSSKMKHRGSNPGLTTSGYYTAHSADGRHWTLDAPTPRWAATDVVTTAWHPGRQCATIAMKRTPRVGGLSRRSIHTARYAQGVYEAQDVCALYPDEYDDMQARSRGFHSADYYGMSMMPAGQDGMVGFLWMFWHQLPYTAGRGNGPQALFGRGDITLVYQMETAGRWLHMPGRPLFIDSERLPGPAGWLSAASNVIEVGHEQRLYFSHRPHPHGFGRTADWQALAGVNTMAGSCITYAAWPKDRLMGFEATGDATLRIDLGTLAQPGRLAINAVAASANGAIRAQVVDGQTPVKRLEQSIPLMGDAVATPLAWQDGQVIPPGRQVAVELHLRDASVFAYEVLPA